MARPELMSLAIRADFRFGFYQGRDERGAPERYPTPARLHAALVSAAHARILTPELDDRSRAVIHWLEHHAPDAIAFPAARLSGSGPTSYRNKGLVEKGHGGAQLAVKKASEPATRISAVDGPLRWWWEQEPEEDVIDALAEICNEVPYLGESVSSVRLTVERGLARPEGAYERVREPSLDETSPGYAIARPGRYDALQDAFLGRVSAKVPSVSSDSYSTSEAELSDLRVRVGLSTEVYAPVQPAPPRAPWASAIRLPVSVAGEEGRPWRPSPHELTAWSVALHRALVRCAGASAPPLLTGHYEAAAGLPVVKPANRLAIQVVPSEGEERAGGFDFVLMIPRDADPDEVRALRDALGGLRRIYRNPSAELEVNKPQDVSVLTFWHPVPPGSTRWWVPSPVMIPDSRPPAMKSRSLPWTVSDAIALAMGFVWRDDFASEASAVSERNTVIARAVRERGVRIVGARRDYTRNPSDYAHRVNPSLVISCVTGLIDAGPLMTSRQLIAIGQSRHLGGGLLVPVDVPTSLLDGEGVPRWVVR